MLDSQWNGKKVAFLGDSITDKCHVGTTRNYWQYLQEYFGIEPLVYGLNGWSWTGIPEQGALLKKGHPNDVDAIFVFMGTNDYNGNVPIGKWWSTHAESVNSHGKQVMRQRRTFEMDKETFCGRINIGMKYLKENFPEQQIILMTPIHRGFAQFGGDNVQPEESFPNDIGLYLESYISVIREAADIWSVPLIDLYRDSGLFPTSDVYAKYFHDSENDRLHPAAAGHARIAKTMMYKMLSLPSDFKN